MKSTSRFDIFALTLIGDVASRSARIFTAIRRETPLNRAEVIGALTMEMDHRGVRSHGKSAEAANI